MGAVVARTYVFSHGNGGGFHIRGPDGRLDEAWFGVFDRLLALASELGVRLLVPFVNTFWYPLWGSTDMYAIWLGGGEDPAQFFYSHAQRELFKTVLSRILLRVNSLTGRRCADGAPLPLYLPSSPPVKRLRPPLSPCTSSCTSPLPHPPTIRSANSGMSMSRPCSRGS